MTQVFVVVLVLRIPWAIYIPCVLIQFSSVRSNINVRAVESEFLCTPPCIAEMLEALRLK